MSISHMASAISSAKDPKSGALPYKLTKLNAVREQHLLLEFTKDTYTFQAISALGVLIERLCKVSRRTEVNI